MHIVRAIIPDLLNFGYIPADQVKLHSSESDKPARGSSPTYALPSASILDEEEHVLILDFVESTKRTKSAE
jgi:DEAD/DEAH box helicase domain-containing protein